MVVLLLANVANTIANFGGAAAALDIFGVPKWLTVPVVAVAIWGLVLFASYRLLERVFLLVMLVFLAYPIAAVLARGLGPVFNALVTPDVPLDPRSLLLLVAVVGTTITPYMQFYLQSAVAEKGIGEEELPLEQADAVVGLGLDQRDRHLHRGRDGGRGRSGGGASSPPRRTRRGRSSRSPGGSPRRCSASACSGRPCSRRRSCRSRPRS